MFWCFVGIEAFAHMGEEFKNPERDFPISIVLGCLFAGLIYWACTVVILKFHAYGTAEMDTAAIPWLSETLIGSKASLLISLLGYLACFASMNLYMQSLSRMTWSLAKKNRSDSRLAQLSSRGVPAHATLTIAVVLITCSMIGELLHLDLAYLVKLANGVFILIYLFAMLAAYQLLTGIHKYLAAVALAITAVVFACLQWAALYAVVAFLILHFLPQRRFTLGRKADTP
jgi:amino acid efflux transporter